MEITFKDLQTILEDKAKAESLIAILTTYMKVTKYPSDDVIRGMLGIEESHDE